MGACFKELVIGEWASRFCQSFADVYDRWSICELRGMEGRHMSRKKGAYMFCNIPKRSVARGSGESRPVG